MFLVSARLSSSLPSSFCCILSFYIIILFTFIQKLCTLEKFSKHITFFSLSTFYFFVLPFFGSFYVSRAATERSLLYRSGDLWYFTDGLFYIIDFSVILNYRKKGFSALCFGEIQLKVERCLSCAHIGLPSIFAIVVISFLQRDSPRKKISHWFSPSCAFTPRSAALWTFPTWIFIALLHFRFCCFFFVYDSRRNAISTWQRGFYWQACRFRNSMCI